ncbi:hypothetical protein [Paenarthrobacter sp. NCHU4564]|uniref:hypothetical protein n=1 Tax=Paenarthrobacter sp. NCHU4564 TaxID=3451353 RepID=UPI003F9D68D8
MEDPTTLAINLTYLGTLGMAVLMFLGLGLIIIITLVIAGIGRLLSVVLLAMVGIFPKKDTVAIVHLPPRPQHVPAPAGAGVVDSEQTVESPLEDLAYEPAGSTPAPSPAPETVPAAVAPPKRDLLGDVRRRLSGASAAVKGGGWKAKVDPRNLPKPAQVKDWATNTSKTVVETQTQHHPLIVAASKEPPVLSKDWADAVARADERAAARAKAEQPPAIKVTVRDFDEPGSTNGTPSGPKAPDTPSSNSAKPGGNGKQGTAAGTGTPAKKPSGAKQPAGASQGNTSKPAGEPKPAREPAAPATGQGAGTQGAGQSTGTQGASTGTQGASTGAQGAKKPGPAPSRNGKTPSPIRKGSLSGASRNN